MSKTTKRKTIVTLICCLLIMVIFSGCNGLNPFYNSGIRIKLVERQAEILIKEEEHLMGSIAKIYYIEGNENVLLGQILSGENGFSAFESGLYSVEVEDNKLTIEWCNASRKIKDHSMWSKKTFDLPINTGG